MIGGRIWSRYHMGRQDDVETMAGRLQLSWERLRRHGPLRVDHDHVDETNLLGRWLSVNSHHPALLPLPADGQAIDWSGMLSRVFDIELGDLIFDQRSVMEIEPAQAAADEAGL